MQRSAGLPFFLLIILTTALLIPVPTNAQHDVPDTFTGLAWSPDSSHLAYSGTDEGGDHDVWVIEWATGYNFNRTNDLPGNQFNPVWSPDSRHIVFAGEETIGPTATFAKTDVWMMDVDGTHLVNLTEGHPLRLIPTSFSPDGQFIAVFSFDLTTLQSSAWLLPLDGSDLIPLAPPDLDTGDPIFSPDGRQIVFRTLSRTTPIEYQLWSVPLENNVPGEATPILTSSHEIGEFDWANDSQQLVLSRRMVIDGKRVWRLQILNMESRELTLIDNGLTEHQIAPVWSSDQRYIAFLALDESYEQGTVYIMDWREGTLQNQLSGLEGGYPSDVAWSWHGPLAMIYTVNANYHDIYWIENIESGNTINFTGGFRP